MNWKPISKMAADAAAGLGHGLGPFTDRKGSRTSSLKMASCEKCYGCCWTAGGDR